jgi:hypothetical protein
MLIPIGLLSTVLSLLASAAIYTAGVLFLTESRAQNVSDGLALASEMGFDPGDYLKLIQLGQAKFISSKVEKIAETTTAQVCLATPGGHKVCAHSSARSD